MLFVLIKEQEVIKSFLTEKTMFDNVSLMFTSIFIRSQSEKYWMLERVSFLSEGAKLNSDLGLVPKKISSCITNPALVIFNILLSSMGKLLLDNPFVYQKAEIFMI